MIGWLNPAALTALAAAALPVVVHLLLRNRATRVVVPSVRFIASTRESAIRIRRPSDPVLLLIRTLVLLCAGLALAAPILLTGFRSSIWMTRSIRAIVIDTSVSVDATAAAEVAAAESAGAFADRRFEDSDVATAIARAAAWLQAAPPGRQELVVVSDFQHGTVSPAFFNAVPIEAGVRTVAVGRAASSHNEVDGGVVQFGPHRYAQRITLDSRGTSYRLQELAAASDVDFIPGASSSPDLAKLARTVAAAGVFVRPFDPAAIQLEAPPESLEAAIAVHDVLARRPDLATLSDAEPDTIPSATVTSWNRDARAPSSAAWRRSTDSDARWFWLAAILLMGVEALLRRDRRPASASAAEERAA